MLKKFNNRTRQCNYVCAFLTVCLLIFQFTPFWHFNGKTMSINGYVWLDPGNSEIASWFTSQLGAAPNINTVVTTTVLVLLLGVASVVLCIWKADNRFIALLPAACALSGIYGFLVKPVFRLGSSWILQLILCILILAVAILAIGFKKEGQEIASKKAESQEEITAREASIKALGERNGKKKETTMDDDKNFNLLLNFLRDEEAECRIAAAETLGKTSRDAAFTYISYLMEREEDKKVIEAMRAALSSIRENMNREHAEKS